MWEYLTTPGSLISAVSFSGAPAEGPTSKVNSGLENGMKRDQINEHNW